MPGTYHFAVISENDTYSSTSTYTVTFNKIANMANFGSNDIIGICENAGIYFQMDEDGSNGYVNGNPIDYSYSYHNTLSNSAGYQMYDIAIQPRSDVYIANVEAVYYHSSTRPAMNVSRRPALLLTYYSENNFYRVHCRCTGAYSMNNLWEDFRAVSVLIDPATGNLIDIYNFNYYYDFAPVGSNSITITSPYTMSFYQV